MRSSGEGSFAKVEIVVDYQSGSLHALKKFNKSRYISFIKIILLKINYKSEYFLEKQMYNELVADFSFELNQLN